MSVGCDQADDGIRLEDTILTIHVPFRERVPRPPESYAPPDLAVYARTSGGVIYHCGIGAISPNEVTCSFPPVYPASTKYVDVALYKLGGAQLATWRITHLPPTVRGIGDHPTVSTVAKPPGVTL